MNCGWNPVGFPESTWKYNTVLDAQMFHKCKEEMNKLPFILSDSPFSFIVKQDSHRVEILFNFTKVMLAYLLDLSLESLNRFLFASQNWANCQIA